jgi:hypothetical protein
MWLYLFAVLDFEPYFKAETRSTSVNDFNYLDNMSFSLTFRHRASYI